MLIDHIFIFVPSKQYAEPLIKFGITEGSSNFHPGIGTANRRFFFENFYLEVLWIENESEAKSHEEIGLWKRSTYQNSGYSRFGLCLGNTKDTDSFFLNAIEWKPQFLGEGKHVDIIARDDMSWIFRLPPNRSKPEEPTTHKEGMKRLSLATFHSSAEGCERILDPITNSSIAQFTRATTNSLALEFDHGKQGKTKQFEHLDLTISY